MLPPVLALLLPSEAARVAAPPPCAWELDQPQVLIPMSGMIPRNASFWVKIYSPQQLTVEAVVGGPIAVDRIDTPFIDDGGMLVELRPKELLEADTPYSLRAGAFGVMATLRTTEITDRAKPEVPDVLSADAIATPYQYCQTAGIVIYVHPPGEDVIYLFEDPTDGSLYEAYSNLMTMGIPTDVNASISFRAVAVDLAGNRSDATETFERTAGEFPTFTSDRDGSRSSGGCSCVPLNGARSRWLALALGFLILRRRLNVRTQGRMPTSASFASRRGSLLLGLEPLR